MSNDTNYVSKATTTLIKATSRASVKVRDSFYTVEYTEERTVPANIERTKELPAERQLLWDAVNAEVDNQIADIVNSFK
jgi:hypothetical protein